MRRAEHASFIKGLEAARRLSNLKRTDCLGNDGLSRVTAAVIWSAIDARIRRERKKARVK